MSRDLPAPKRALCEQLVAALGLYRGSCKLTLSAHDGELRYVLLEEKISASKLDPPSDGSG
jgi:hypothetical protein